MFVYWLQGECLERVVKRAEAFEVQQQTAKLVLPAEQPLDGVEALFKNGWLEQRLEAAFGPFPASLRSIPLESVVGLGVGPFSISKAMDSSRFDDNRSNPLPSPPLRQF
ncbi:hypothetical protein [Paraburkholderia susongensis]|uniref:hypothetical protein n=1 Tax=Paraburkholderia susongensis TaxID=1515439 RepID=UPI000A1CC3B4|nr:hypothetical protein [Paraburkholderia susongensis]